MRPVLQISESGGRCQLVVASSPSPSLCDNTDLKPQRFRIEGIVSLSIAFRSFYFEHRPKIHHMPFHDIIIGHPPISFYPSLKVY